MQVLEVGSQPHFFGSVCFRKLEVSSVSLEALKKEEEARAAAEMCFVSVRSPVEFAFSKLCSEWEEDASIAIALKPSTVKEGGRRRADTQPAV